MSLSKKCNIVIAVWVVLLTLMFTLLYIHQRADAGVYDIGVRCVQLLYDFDDPGELASNQLVVKQILSDEEFERLQLDEPNRTINAYYKFQYSQSTCNIFEYGEGYVLYTISNEYIDPNTLWVFLYDVGEDGRIENVREYRSLNIKEGNMGVIE